MTEFPIKHSDSKTADSKTTKTKLLSDTKCIFSYERIKKALKADKNPR